MCSLEAEGSRLRSRAQLGDIIAAVAHQGVPRSGFEQLVHAASASEGMRVFPAEHTILAWPGIDLIVPRTSIEDAGTVAACLRRGLAGFFLVSLNHCVQATDHGRASRSQKALFRPSCRPNNRPKPSLGMRILTGACSTSIRFEGWRQLELRGPSSGYASVNPRQ